MIGSTSAAGRSAICRASRGVVEALGVREVGPEADPLGADLVDRPRTESSQKGLTDTLRAKTSRGCSANSLGIFL